MVTIEPPGWYLSSFLVDTLYAHTTLESPRQLCSWCLTLSLLNWFKWILVSASAATSTWRAPIVAVSGMTSSPSQRLIKLIFWNANLTVVSSLSNSGSPVASIAPLLGLERCTGSTNAVFEWNLLFAFSLWSSWLPSFWVVKLGGIFAHSRAFYLGASLPCGNESETYPMFLFSSLLGSVPSHFFC